jgi:hypothetical protein
LSTRSSGHVTAPVLPLCFEDSGDGTADFFTARGADYLFSIAPTSVQLILQSRENQTTGSQSPANEPRIIRFEFVGANSQAPLCALDKLSGSVNYLIGNDPAQWRAHCSLYQKVRAAQLYPGIDVLYHGNGQKLEYDFEIAPGADPQKIAVRFNGVDSLRIDPDGDLVIVCSAQEIRQPRPAIYQSVAGHRQLIPGAWRLRDSQTVDFALGSYDKARALVIDPMLSYSSFFGGNLLDVAYGVKVGLDGSIYIAGETTSRKFTFGDSTNFNAQFSGGRFTGDAFVAKLAPGGTNLVYFTYIGGRGNESARDLAIDDSGHAFITGFTDSTNFPIVFTNVVYGLTNHINGRKDPNAHVYRSDAFIAELDTEGASLVYSAYLGGSLADVATGIALDPEGNAYVTGYTYSTNFPFTNAFQTNLAGTNDIFVAKIAPLGSALLYSTYVGGTNADEADGIAADASGVVYVTGFTSSTNFPCTSNALQSQISGSTNAAQSYRGRHVPADAFLLRIDTTLAGAPSLTYSTLLGGTNNDYGFRIALDTDTNVYITGNSSSTNFPNFGHATNIAVGAVRGAVLNSDAFLTKFHFDAPDTATMVYSILFGGLLNETGWGVVVDGAGNAYVAGASSSRNFATNNNFGFLRGTNGGRSDAFVAAFDTNAAPLFSAYLGGRADDFAYALALDASTNLYVVGKTSSINFPTNAPVGQQPLQTKRYGPPDAFLAIISTATPPPPAPAENSQNTAMPLVEPLPATDRSNLLYFKK